jgi:hypothetical protein
MTKVINFSKQNCGGVFHSRSYGFFDMSASFAGRLNIQKPKIRLRLVGIELNPGPLHKNKQTFKRGNRASNFSVKRELSDSTAYSGQQVFRARLTATNSLLSTTITTGVIAQAYTVSAGSITGFTTRFGSTFDEYRILGVKIRIRPLSAATGVSAMWFDEKVTSSPTINEATERTVVLYSNSNASSKTNIDLTWNARDLLDLQYTAIGTTSVVPVTFKIYTDVSNYGAPATVTPVWIVEPVFMVEFRGVKST